MQSKLALRLFAATWVALLSVTLGTDPARASYIHVGGTSETVYGVADYGGPPVPGIPLYIDNTFTGVPNSVLITPGGGFLTADTSNPNNIADTGVVGIPHYSALIGGGNANGFFGAGQALLDSTLYGFTLEDANLDGGGAASYLVSSMISTFEEDGTGFGGAGLISVGSWLAVSGIFGSPLSAGAAALTVLVESANVASPFFGGRTYEVVLAAAAIGNYNSVAYADVNDVILGSAVMFNDGVDPFFGLAVASELLPTAGMIGDTVTVRSTLTVIADPMFFFSNDARPDLLDLVGPLPSFSFAGTTSVVPEPTSLALVGIGVFGFLTRAMRRRRKNAA